ncbi:hypothetical protein ACLI4U_19200 (plasmid) [Natrialbaceae archaeon A-CW2]
MTERKRDSDGKLSSGDVYSDVDFIGAVRELDTATTVRVAESVGCERTTAHKRLSSLEERGELEKEDIGGVLVWSVED